MNQDEILEITDPTQLLQPIQVDLLKLDTNVDSQSLKTYIRLLRNQNMNINLMLNMIKFLAEKHQLVIAYAITLISLEKFPDHPILSNYKNTWDYLSALPKLEEIKIKLKNDWFQKQIYHRNKELPLFYIQTNRSDENQEEMVMSNNPPDELNSSTNNSSLNNSNSSQQILDQILKGGDQIESYPDTIMMVPTNQEYYIYRNFHLEPFTTYQLTCKCLTNLKPSLHVSTSHNHTRLDYQLSRSLIQYRFQSLNLDQLKIGLRGINDRKSQTVEQFRLIELSIKKIPTVEFVGPKQIRQLTPKVPVIGTINFPDRFIFTEEFLDRSTEWLSTIIPQIDFLNIYLPNATIRSLPEQFEHPNMKVFTKLLPYPGTLHFIRMQPGFHFHFDPNYRYSQDYIPSMIAKIQEHHHQNIFGLYGIQFIKPSKTHENLNRPTRHSDQQLDQQSDNQRSDNQQTTKTEKNIITPQTALNQDIKCHILGLETIAFFSQALTNFINHQSLKEYFEPDLGINHGLILAKLCQENQTSLISIERTRDLAKPIHDYQYKFNEQDQEVIEDTNWKYFN